MSHLGVLALIQAASTKKTTSSSSSEFFLIIIVGFGALWYFFIRPQQQKARKAREDVKAFEVGDEIVTVGGIVGRVLDVEGDRVTILTGEGGSDGTVPTRLVMVRQAIARKAEPAVPPSLSDSDSVDAHDDAHDDGEDGEHEHDEDEHGDDAVHDAHDDQADDVPHEAPTPPPRSTPPVTERPPGGAASKSGDTKNGGRSRWRSRKADDT